MEFKIQDIEKIKLKDLKLIKISNNYIFIAIYNKLKLAKSLIDNHYKNWDNVKKYINPYELINSNKNTTGHATHKLCERSHNPHIKHLEPWPTWSRMSPRIGLGFLPKSGRQMACLFPI